MPISARNQLIGRISEVELGDIMAHVTVRIGKDIVESVITRKSADELALKKGDTVTVVIKSTEVMLRFCRRADCVRIWACTQHAIE